MITRLLVIQNILADGEVKIYQLETSYFQWSFEHRRSKVDGDREYFPFQIHSNLEPLTRKPGPETLVNTKDNEIIFCDDYCVPAGTVIGILLPRLFIPDVIKFKDKPSIPINIQGTVISKLPGQLQTYHNHQEKRCAIVFNIHENICFGFKSILQKMDENAFPRQESAIADDLFDITLSRDFLNVKSISNDDLKLINNTLSTADIDDIHNSINSLLASIRSRQRDECKSTLHKIGQQMLSGIAVTANISTIADGFKQGNLSQQLLGKILDYSTL